MKHNSILLNLEQSYLKTNDDEYIRKVWFILLPLSIKVVKRRLQIWNIFIPLQDVEDIAIDNVCKAVELIKGNPKEKDFPILNFSGFLWHSTYNSFRKIWRENAREYNNISFNDYLKRRDNNETL